MNRVPQQLLQPLGVSSRTFCTETAAALKGRQVNKIMLLAVSVAFDQSAAAISAVAKAVN